MTLTLFNPSTDVWKEVHKGYRPYFFISHPLTQKSQKILHELHAKTKIEDKRELFTGQTIRVTKVEIQDSMDPRQPSEKFEKSWEGEVPFILSFAYDQ